MNVGSGIPLKTAIVQGRKYRFTVLTSRLIRMEYSEKSIFVDNLTQVVTDRNFPAVEFRVTETKNMLEIITDDLRLKYDKKAFSSEGLSIAVKGQSAYWSYGDLPKDLGGTVRTLDGANGEIPLEPGIQSANGWSLLDDGSSLLLNAEGWVEAREDRQARDIYFFGYGRDYLACLKDFHRLTGNVPLLPRYALGNWWSRYYRYSEQSYLELMKRFEEEQIPFTVAVIDMDWHLTDIDPRYGSGWTGYSWNRELFPDPERFMKILHEKGMHVTLNIHPADGIRAFEDCYRSFAEYMGVDWEKGEPIPFDVGNPKFMKGYFELVHHPLEAQGVDFWWIDWQQGTHSGMEGLDPLWMLNHFHYLDSCRNGKRGIIFSRYGGVGSHRYPVGFSGDTIISWDSLRFQPYFTVNASNIGYGWWSHDIGGHIGGSKNDELAARWLQFGVFSPIMRLHSSCSEFNGKEPWRYNLTVQTVMKRFLRLRHRMVPYLYTMNLRASRESIPLLQPLYYYEPMCTDAYQQKNEYYFGTELIVCPITDPVDRESGMAGVHGWLPDGLWTDYFTGAVYEGNRWVDWYRGIDKIPVLIKAGGIFVLDGRTQDNQIDNPDILEICVNAMGNGQFTLMEDDGQETEYSESHWCRTMFQVETGNNVVFTILPAEGNVSAVPLERGYRIRFYGLKTCANPMVTVDGMEIRDYAVEYEKERGILEIRLEGISVQQKIVIDIGDGSKHDNQRRERIFSYLNQAEIAFDDKETIYKRIGKLEGDENPIDVIGELRELPIRETIIEPVVEILTACGEL